MGLWGDSMLGGRWLLWAGLGMLGLSGLRGSFAAELLCAEGKLAIPEDLMRWGSNPGMRCPLCKEQEPLQILFRSQTCQALPLFVRKEALRLSRA